MFFIETQVSDTGPLGLLLLLYDTLVNIDYNICKRKRKYYLL